MQRTLFRRKQGKGCCWRVPSIEDLVVLVSFHVFMSWDFLLHLEQTLGLQTPQLDRGPCFLPALKRYRQPETQ